MACIGGGPASLACAAELCRAGARATVIERRELPGGLNTYGVAEYKLRAADSVREVEMIRRLGVEFRCGVDVDSAAALEALEAEFDFIFLGMGLGAMQRLNVPGEDTKGVMNALELIAAYKTGHLRELHGTVVVVGAGNTAIDAANAARRLGAATVYLLYRRSESRRCPPSTSSMSTPSRKACNFCGAGCRWPSGRRRMGGCCWRRCRCGRRTASSRWFRIRKRPSIATWWCRPSASRR